MTGEVCVRGIDEEYNAMREKSREAKRGRGTRRDMKRFGERFGEECVLEGQKGCG